MCRYVKSRSDPQLQGGSPTYLDGCLPQEFEGGNSSRTANPCGLVAWSLFNDTFTVRDSRRRVSFAEGNACTVYDNIHFFNKLRCTALLILAWHLLETTIRIGVVLSAYALSVPLRQRRHKI